MQPAPFIVARLIYCFRCVLKALRPMQHFSHQLPALGRSRQLGGGGGGHRLEGVPALQGSPNNLEENKQTYFCMCECVRVCRCVTNIKFPSQSKGQAPCPCLWHAQAPGRGRLPSGMELPCSIPILFLLLQSELIPVAGGARGGGRGQRRGALPLVRIPFSSHTQLLGAAARPRRGWCARPRAVHGVKGSLCSSLPSLFWAGEGGRRGESACPWHKELCRELGLWCPRIQSWGLEGSGEAPSQGWQSPGCS